MDNTIITTITPTGTVYSIGSSASVILSDLAKQLMGFKIDTPISDRRKIMIQLFNTDVDRRGGFTSLPRKSYTNLFL